MASICTFIRISFFLFFFWGRHMFARSVLTGTTPVLLHCCFWGATGTIELSAVTHNRDAAVPPLRRETVRYRFKHLHPHLHLRSFSSPAPKRSQRKQSHWFLISFVSTSSTSQLSLAHTQIECTHLHTGIYTHPVHHRDFCRRRSEAPHLFREKFCFFPPLLIRKTLGGHEDGKSSCFLLFSKNFYNCESKVGFGPEA